MECPSCKNCFINKQNEQFDKEEDQKYYPCILTSCGHSICNTCIINLSKSSNSETTHNQLQTAQKVYLVCPLCQQINHAESISRFPLNFQLLEQLKKFNLFDFSSEFESKEIFKEQEYQESQNYSFNTEDQILITQTQNSNALSNDKNSSQINKLKLRNQNSQTKDKLSEEISNNNPQNHQEELCLHEEREIKMNEETKIQTYKNIKNEEDEDELENLSLSKQNLNTQESQQSNDQLEKQIRKHFIQQAVRALDMPYQDIQESSLDLCIKDTFIKNQSTSKSKQFESPEEDSENVEEEHRQEPAKNTDELCYIHEKNIQGYCINEKLLLCIDCILSGNHKNHEICAIDKAAKIERDILTVRFQQSKIQKDLVEHTLFKNQNHQELLKNQSFDYLVKLKQLFIDVRALIDEKEKQMVKEIDSKLQKELKHLLNREKEGKSKIQQINQFQESWHKLGEINEIQFLQTLTQRQQDAEKALSETKAVKINHSIPKFNKDLELAQLSKFILNSSSLVPAQSSTAQNQQSHPQTPFEQTSLMLEEKNINQISEQVDVKLNVNYDQIPKYKTIKKRDHSIMKGSFQNSNIYQSNQINLRSASTKPILTDQSQVNSQFQGNQKASYMQATSSWAKKQTQNFKEKEMNQEKKLIEEKNKIQQNNIKGLKNYMNSNLNQNHLNFQSQNNSQIQNQRGRIQTSLGNQNSQTGNSSALKTTRSPINTNQQFNIQHPQEPSTSSAILNQIPKNLKSDQKNRKKQKLNPQSTTQNFQTVLNNNFQNQKIQTQTNSEIIKNKQIMYFQHQSNLVNHQKPEFIKQNKDMIKQINQSQKITDSQISQNCEKQDQLTSNQSIVLKNSYIDFGDLQSQNALKELENDLNSKDFELRTKSIKNIGKFYEFQNEDDQIKNQMNKSFMQNDLQKQKCSDDYKESQQLLQNVRSLELLDQNEQQFKSEDRNSKQGISQYDNQNLKNQEFQKMNQILDQTEQNQFQDYSQMSQKQSTLVEKLEQMKMMNYQQQNLNKVQQIQIPNEQNPNRNQITINTNTNEINRSREEEPQNKNNSKQKKHNFFNNIFEKKNQSKLEETLNDQNIENSNINTLKKVRANFILEQLNLDQLKDIQKQIDQKQSLNIRSKNKDSVKQNSLKIEQSVLYQTIQEKVQDQSKLVVDNQKDYMQNSFRNQKDERQDYHDEDYIQQQNIKIVAQQSQNDIPIQDSYITAKSRHSRSTRQKWQTFKKETQNHILLTQTEDSILNNTKVASNLSQEKSKHSDEIILANKNQENGHINNEETIQQTSADRQLQFSNKSDDNEELQDIEYIEEDDLVIEDKTETFSHRKNESQQFQIQKEEEKGLQDLSLKEKIINAQKQQISQNEEFHVKRQLFKSNIIRENSLDKQRNIHIQKSFFNQKHLSQYQDDLSQNIHKIIQYDDTSKSEIEFSQFAQSESINYNESQISGLRHDIENIEPSFSIFAISGYCDKPLYSNEKITIKFSSLNQPFIFWNSSSKQNRIQDAQLFKYEKLPQGWESVSDLNIARTKFQAIVLPKLSKAKRIKDQLWILGGKNQQSQRIDSIEIYDSKQNIWISNPLIKMRKPKSGFASVYFRNNQRSLEQLIIIGGNDGQVQNRVEFMNVADFQWHKCASMINRRDELAACIGPDNLIYAIGGYGGSTNSSCLSSVERYYPLENKWEQVASMNEGRRALAAIAMPDGIYAIGGYNGKDYIATVERYDILKDRWTIICNLNSAKCTMTAVPSPNFKTFYVIGGFNGAQLNHVEVFDSQTQSFKIFKYPMIQKRFMHASAVMTE